MKTPDNYNEWVKNKVLEEYKKVPADVVESARRLKLMEVIHDQISRRTGINTDAVQETLKQITPPTLP